MANFVTVNFPLLLNFLRTLNVIEPHILPLLSNRCYVMVFTIKLKSNDKANYFIK